MGKISMFYKESLDIAKDRERKALLELCLNAVSFDKERIRYYYQRFELAHERKERARFHYEHSRGLP